MLEKLQCLACHYIQQVSHVQGMLRNINMYKVAKWEAPRTLNHQHKFFFGVLFQKF